MLDKRAWNRVAFRTAVLVVAFSTLPACGRRQRQPPPPPPPPVQEVVIDGYSDPQLDLLAAIGKLVDDRATLDNRMNGIRDLANTRGPVSARELPDRRREAEQMCRDLEEAALELKQQARMQGYSGSTSEIDGILGFVARTRQELRSLPR